MAPPADDFRLVALNRPAGGPLAAEAEPVEPVPDVARMIGDPVAVVDESGQARQGPDLGGMAGGHRPAEDRLREILFLGGGEPTLEPFPAR